MNCDRFVTFKYETGSGGHKKSIGKTGAGKRWSNLKRLIGRVLAVNIVDFVEKP